MSLIEQNNAGNFVSHMLVENANRIANVRDPKKRTAQSTEYAKIILIPLAAHGIPVSLLERINIDFVKPQRNSDSKSATGEPEILQMVREIIDQEFGHELLNRVNLTIGPEKTYAMNFKKR